MANRYYNIDGTQRINEDYPNISVGFDRVQTDMDAAAAEREAIDGRVNTILQGNSETKDPELTDIKSPDPSYTPARPIAVAGDMMRDMQKQFGTQLAETVADVAELDATKAAKTEVNALATLKANQADLLSTNAAVALKANKSDVEAQIAAVASGSPKGVYATLAALQAAYPSGNTNTYVVTADGNWYYWSGSAWTAGGSYQSTGIADATIKQQSLSVSLNGKLLTLKYKNEDQMLINTAYQNGVINTSFAGYNSKKFDVSSEERVRVIGTFRQWIDVYVLLDASDNVLSHFYNTTSNSLAFDQIIDVSAADKIVLCNHRANIHAANLMTFQADDSSPLTAAMTEFKSSDYEPYSGFYNVAEGSLTPAPTNFHTAIVTCQPGERYKVSGATYSTFTALVVFTDGANAIRSLIERGIDATTNIYTEVEITVPAGCTKIFVLSYLLNPLVVRKYAVVDVVTVEHDVEMLKSSSQSYWAGKKIVWFGTSIPAGGYSGLNNAASYPMMVGERLGATVINEAIGSSAAHCKRPSALSPTNPYGFTNNWPVASRCLSNTLEEMEWIIEHFDDTSIFNWQNVTELTGSNSPANIRDCSWEHKLNRHLGEGNRADLYIFDHGHNDEITDSQEAYYTDPTYGGQYSLYTFRGAMNYLINKIKEDNPFARIVILGEYENQKRPKIAEYQQIVANDWSFPIYKQWERLGWSQRTLETTGYWSGGYWVPSGGPVQTITYLNLWLPDTVHPHTDYSGRSTELMAENLAAWINALR